MEGSTTSSSPGGAESLAIRVGAVEGDQPEIIDSPEIGPSGVGHVIMSETLTQQRDPTSSRPICTSRTTRGTVATSIRTARSSNSDPGVRGAGDGARAGPADGPRARRVPPDAARGGALPRPRRLETECRDLLPAGLPGPNGEDLYAALYTPRASEEAAFERVQEALRAAFPGFRKMEFPLVAAGKATLAWHQAGFARAFSPNQLSEGMLRFLWLATTPLSPHLPPVTRSTSPRSASIRSCSRCSPA